MRNLTIPTARTLFEFGLRHLRCFTATVFGPLGTKSKPKQMKRNLLVQTSAILHYQLSLRLLELNCRLPALPKLQRLDLNV